MKHKAARIFFLISTVIPALCQEPRAAIRVEVTGAGTSVSDAIVTVNAVTLRTDPEGIALVTVPLGEVRVGVTKNGYFPANADYTAINFEVWRRLQSDETLWDLDFAPPPPPPQQASNGSAGLVLGACALGAGLLAFNARN